MNYFHPYPLLVDDPLATAWKSQLAEAVNTPWLASVLAGHTSEIFPRFVAGYKNLRSLPRGARRSIQRRLARSRDVLGRSPEGLQPGEGRRLRYKLARSLAGAALLLALAQSVQAAMIPVNTNAPGINDGDSKCSLIEAIVNANADTQTHPDCPAGSGADTIVLPAKKVITLTTPHTNYQGDTGLPVITSQITIEGNGAKIIRKKGSVDFRLVAVSSLGNLELENVRLSGGSAGVGGGIFNAGELVLANSIVTGNLSLDGGGIYNSGHSTITGSAISGNTGYSAVGIDNKGTLTIANSSISINKGSTSITCVCIGGGILNSGSLFIQDSAISGNLAGEAGGLLNGGSATIRNTLISRNTARFGAGLKNHSSLTIDNSTISGNRAEDFGGIFNLGSSLGLSTNTLVISNSTITGNVASHGGSTGGGVRNRDNGYIIFHKSVVAGNKAATAPEIENHDSSMIVANDFNLFGYNSNAGISGFTAGPTDVVPGVGLTVKKILGPLKNNGGPTMTHALVPGSPAIDAVPGADPDCAGTDQRGTPRPKGAGCDIGAFEK